MLFCCFLSCRVSSRQRQTQTGFTLLELIAVVALTAMLMAIMAPAWLRFINTQRLISARAVVHQGLRQAQFQAKRNHADWRFSIRDVDGVVEWSVYPATMPVTAADWQPIGHSSVQIDSETPSSLATNRRAVEFDYRGNVTPPLGRITLSSRQFSEIKRCVYISTVIGELRQSKEQRSANRSGDFCY